MVTAPGVALILCFRGQPVPVLDREIAALQDMVKSGVAREPWAQMPDGTPVLVASGPLAGVVGTTVSSDRPHTLILSVSLLNRYVAVSLGADTALTPLPRPAGTALVPVRNTHGT